MRLRRFMELAPKIFGRDSPLEGTGFEPSVPREPTAMSALWITGSRRQLRQLFSPHGWWRGPQNGSSSAGGRREDPPSAAVSFTAGPMVRIHIPPAVSRQTFGSSAAEPHLLFVIEPAPLYANLASCSRLNLPVREMNGCRSGSAELTFNHSMTLVPRG